jgi:predicted nucleic acid-binding protein
VRFLDTDVLLYAISREADEQGKAKRANSILQDRDVALSVQVLQEFYLQATHSTRPRPITHDQAARLIGSFLRFPVVDMSTEIMLAAMATRQRFELSYWDAAIVEAARAIDCDVVLSESLTDGHDYGGVRVENPFH